MSSSRAAYQSLIAARVGDHRVAEDLVEYALLVEQWSARHSLVSFRSRGELVERHLLEALTAAGRLGAAGRLIDVGSGAGIPAIPLLIARRDWSGLLLEPRQKRWAFLRLVVRELGLEATVLRARYPEVGETDPAELVTVRGLRVDDELLSWARARLGRRGRILMWTTVELEKRLRSRAEWRVVSSALSALEKGRLVELWPCFT